MPRTIGSNKNKNCYFITIPKTTVSKEFAFESLVGTFDQLIITQEKHFDNSKHLHIFGATNDKSSLENIKEIIFEIFETYGDSQPCKNRNNVIKYITKEDMYPMFINVDTAKFSFAYRARQWASTTERYKESDPFVLAHPQYYKLLQSVHACLHEVKTGDLERHQDDFEYLLTIPQWKQEVIKWWNDWIDNGWTHKKKQLYLFGASNTGKTYFIQNEILKNKMAYEPTPESRFAWAEWLDGDYKVVFCDECDLSDFNLSQWKKVVAGEQFKCDIKCGKARAIKIQCPMIFVSNILPPNEPGIMERLNVVYVY